MTQAAARPSNEEPGITTEQLAAIAGELRAATTDLDTYVDRRAAELAAPRIQAAEAAAQQRVDAAAAELRQAGELIAELRRQLDIQSRLHLNLLAEKREREARAAVERAPARGRG